MNRLTNACGHSHLLYFTNPGWTRDGRFLVHASERQGANELWACDLSDFSLLRITDSGPGAAPLHAHNYAILNPVSDEIAYWSRGWLVVLDLYSGIARKLFQAGGETHGLTWTADGAWIATCVNTPRAGVTGSSTEDRLAWRKAPPISQVIAIHVHTGERRILHEEPWLITHVCASPTQPDLLTFCHEGPWLEVKQRIWRLHMSGGAPRPIVPRDPEWGVGHEYWLPDGLTIGYHARHAGDTWRHAAGFCRVNDNEIWQRELPLPTHHAIAANRDFVILDGTRSSGDYVLLVPRVGDGWGDARVVCCHDSSRHHHRSHVHARLSSDSRTVVFNSDRRTYTDVYLVSLPSDLESLPLWPGKPFRYYWE